MPDETYNEPDSVLLAFLSAQAGACPAPELLFAAQEDVLPAEAGAAVRAHIATCSLCRTLLEEMAPPEDVWTNGVDQRVRARIEDGLRPRRGGFRWAIAAAVLLCAAGLGLSHLLRHDEALTAASATPAAEKPLAFEVVELQTVAPLAPPATPVLTARGAAANEPTVEEMLPAFRAYNQADYAAATEAFAALLQRFPHAEVPALYLGVSQLELGRNADALATLDETEKSASPAYAEAATWYLAIATLRSGSHADAIRLFEKECAASGSVYAPRSCVLARLLAAAK